MTSVRNVRKKCLQEDGYQDLEDWLSRSDDHVYIGRDMSVYVMGAKGSKWKNPFSVKRYGRDGCLEKYREYLLDRVDLMSELGELRGKTLGCWCYPEKCHGNILVELIKDRFGPIPPKIRLVKLVKKDD